jgi:transglutaminase-like putative cysteine protease
MSPPAVPPRAGLRLAGRLAWLSQGLLGLGLLALQPGLLLSWLAIGLSLLAGLKLLEARQPQERRLVALLQLVCAGLLGALVSDLAPSLLQALVVVGALASLLALEAGGEPDWPTLLRRSLVVLGAALPMALALFLLLPRLPPFSAAAGLGAAGSRTGLSDRLTPGAIASLASDRSPAARLSFRSGAPPPAGERYWRVLVHDRFDGEGWTVREPRDGRPGGGPERLREGAPATAAPAEELWLAEPSGVAALPWSGRGQPLGQELGISPLGELRRRPPPTQRLLYAIAADAPAAPSPESDWRLAPPGPWDRQIPWGANPELEALGQRWAQLPDPRARLAAAEAWFRSQPFRYSRQPGTLPTWRPLDAFLLERQEGFCGHYASAFSALMRAAGLPARVVSGYQGGEWVVPWGGAGYLDLRQDNAHAWSEVWLPGEGWRRVDPSAWIAAGPGSGLLAEGRRGPLAWLVRQWWGLDLAWGRWWLGFDRNAQEALLQRLLGGRREWVGVVTLATVAAGLGGSLVVLGRLGRRPEGDAPRRELERSLALLARHGLVPEPGDTLPRFLRRAGRRHPPLAADLEGLLEPYQHWRFGPGPRPRGQGRRLAGELRRRRRRLQRLLRLAPTPAPATAPTARAASRP